MSADTGHAGEAKSPPARANAGESRNFQCLARLHFPRGRRLRQPRRHHLAPRDRRPVPREPPRGHRRPGTFRGTAVRRWRIHGRSSSGPNGTGCATRSRAAARCGRSAPGSRGARSASASCGGGWTTSAPGRGPGASTKNNRSRRPAGIRRPVRRLRGLLCLLRPTVDPFLAATPVSTAFTSRRARRHGASARSPCRVTRPARAISSHTLKPFMELLGESRPVDAVDDGPGRLVAPVLRVRDIPVPRRHAFRKQRSTTQIHSRDFFQL